MLLPLLAIAVPDAPALLPREGWQAPFARLLDPLPGPWRLPAVLLLFATLMVLRAGLQLLRDRHALALQLDFVDQLRTRLFDAISHARWAYLVQRHSSEALNTLTADIQRIGVGTHFLLQLLTQGTLLLIHLALALALSPAMTLLAVLAAALLWWLTADAGQGALGAGAQFGRASQTLLAEVQEALAALRMTRAHGDEERWRQRFVDALGALRTQQLRFRRQQTYRQFVHRAAGALLLAGICYIALAGLDTPLPVLTVLIALFARVIPQLQQLQLGLSQLHHMLPAYEHWRSRLDDCVAHAEPPETGDSGPTLLRRALQLQGVSLPSGDGRPRLQVDQLTLPAATTTAVIGPSGAGKTTLLDLLAGLHEPIRGEIRVDGETAALHVRGWRGKLAYLDQDASVGSGSVREFLCRGWPDAPEAALWEALAAAGAADFVGRLPRGLDSSVGERGARLSGGERQRLALAGVLLRQPQLLLLDEAGSALDDACRNALADTLQALRGRITIVLVTHRPEELAPVLDGCIRVEAGVVGPWQAWGQVP